MGVTLREKTIKNGMLSLYLDYYPPIKLHDGKLTRREFLNRYIYKKPKNEEEKRINKENKLFAEAVRLEREKQILSEENGFFNTSHKKKDFIEYYQKLVDHRYETKSNYDNWISSLKYLQAYTSGQCKMGDVNEAFCNNYKNYLLNADILKKGVGRKLSRNSASSYFNKFRAVVKKAFEDKAIPNNPLLYVKGIQETENKRDFLTEEELKKLIQTDCDPPIIKKLALFAAFTGLRWSDIKELKWENIQHTTEKGYFIHKRQVKTEGVIMHPINEAAYKVLGEQGEAQELIFSKFIYSENNNNKLKKWICEAGINKKITLHNFRHTYATLLLHKGADIFTVSKLLGHKNIKTTMIYSKILDEKKISASNLLDFEI